MLGYNCQPLRFNRFDAFIQEKNPWVVRFVYREILCCGVVGLPWVAQQMMGETRQKIRCAMESIVLNDHNLVIRITCSAGQTFNASLQRFEAAAASNNH